MRLEQKIVVLPHSLDADLGGEARVVERRNRAVDTHLEGAHPLLLGRIARLQVGNREAALEAAFLGDDEIDALDDLAGREGQGLVQISGESRLVVVAAVAVHVLAGGEPIGSRRKSEDPPARLLADEVVDEVVSRLVARQDPDEQRAARRMLGRDGAADDGIYISALLLPAHGEDGGAAAEHDCRSNGKREDPAA